MRIKKNLNFTSLRKSISKHVKTWRDPRTQGNIKHSLHDAILSGLACMYFQEPSLLNYQREMEKKRHKNNLKTLFGVQDIPSNNAMNAMIDNQESKLFTPIFKDFIQKLQRSNQLKPYQLMNGMMVHSIDATMYHTSKKVHCKECLTKNHKNGTTTYQHFSLQGALMHPDIKQVIPTFAEPIHNTDGSIKQDCETNAAKRYIPELRKLFPKMDLIITGDDLFSRQPMIETVIQYAFHFIFVAKPTSHTYMAQWLLDNSKLLNEVIEVDNQGRTITYQWLDSVPLCANDGAPKVNYFSKTTIDIGTDGKNKKPRIESWVTDLTVNTNNIILLCRAAKSRWKIENECFNTLKNQGYHLSHNYGHGEKNLAFNYYLLTLLAFTLHQIAELCDNAFQACRKLAGSKRNLWEKLRSSVDIVIFENMEQLLRFYYRQEDFLINANYEVRAKSPP
jgi:hypothetical protein